MSRLLRRIKWGRVGTYILVICLVSFTALPLVYIVSTAFKPIEELFLFPPKFFVMKPTIANFADLFTALSTTVVPFSRYVFNSVVSAGAAVFGTVFVSSFGAYGLVRFKPKGSNVIMAFVIAILMFSPHVLQIPNYIIVKELGMLNSLWSLIIPKLAVAYNFFLMERFASQIPTALIEAAYIDGASEWTVFWKIAMPVLKPAWSTLIVLSFISNWNDYFSALVYLNKTAVKTLPLALQTMAGGVGVAELARAGAVAAVSFIMVVPPIIIYLFMQNKVMKTMAFSGIK